MSTNSHINNEQPTGGILSDGAESICMDPPRSAKNLQALKSSCVSSEGASSGITYASQNSLPRLPIPELDLTLHRFKARLEALQDEEQRFETATVVEEFLENEGPVLQEALEEYDREGSEKQTIGSFVEEFWNESYLSPDSAVVLNLNPYFVLEEGPDPKIAKDQLRRAASLCFAAIKLASALKNEKLPPDVFRGMPLCMDQFKALFGSSRQPTVHGSDDVHVYNDSSHVVVLCKNQFYYFSALWPDSGNVAVDEQDILAILKAIRLDSTRVEMPERTRTALGVFTSLPRSQWAAARQDLCKIEMNKTSLHVIDSALFVLVLDNYKPTDIHVAAANMLHGTNQLSHMDTMQVGSCLNRWYDKLQLIVCGDGTSGLVFEHSIIDGHTALRFVSDVFAETVISFAESIVDLIHGRGRITHVVEATIKRAATVAHTDGSSLDVLPKKLLFDLPDSIIDRIYYAETALCDEIVASDTFVLEYREYGKKLIVGNKMSPDAFVQMSIILAYYKLYGKVVCMYEPALTKQFFHGRTGSIRGTTPQAKELCEVWCDKKATSEQKLHALRRATSEHSRLTKEAAFGQGIDRHLYALKCLAARKGMPTPPFFESDAWKTLNHTVLSTSNCGNPALRLFGFGPVVPDGFGIGYIIKDSAISYSVCSKHRQTRRYVRSLRNSLNEMQELLDPLTTVEVKQKKKRPTLQEMKDTLLHQTNSFSDYGGLWGENNKAIEQAMGHKEEQAEAGDQSPSSRGRPQLQRKASVSKYFSRIKERGSSLDFLLRVTDSSVDVNLGTHEEDKNGE